MKEDKEELSFAERLSSPCKVFHGTSADYVDAAMEDRGKGFWFTRNPIDAEWYAKRGNLADGGQPRVLEAWVRMEKVLDGGKLYDEATDEVLKELAHDAHVRYEELLKLRAVIPQNDELGFPCLFEITNTPAFIELVRHRFEGMYGIEENDGRVMDVCCVFSRKNIYFEPHGSVAKTDIGILDADLLDHGTRHPNLALMKLSGWYNRVHREGEHVRYPKCSERKARLVLQEDLDRCLTVADLVGPGRNCLFGKIVVSKVFDFSKLPELLQRAFDDRQMVEGQTDIRMYRRVEPRIVYGGTGFVERLERLPNDLPAEIEHHFPDYHLYDEFIKREIVFAGKKPIHYKDYSDYSIGFLTRGCFRRCPFCVNKHQRAVRPHSHLQEFFDPDRRYIYLWDDNFLGMIDHADRDVEEIREGRVSWQSLLNELKESGRAFQFRQGMDIRLVTPELARILSECHYHGDYIFAFDHYNQKADVVRGLLNWKRENPTSIPKFYVLTGFRCKNREIDDILETLKRIRILMHFGTLPYIMRHIDYKGSPFSGLHTQLARWCNQPQFFKKKSFREFVEANQAVHEKSGMQLGRKNPECATLVAYKAFVEYSEKTGKLSRDGRRTDEIAHEFFDLKWESLRHLWNDGAYGEPIEL